MKLYAVRSIEEKHLIGFYWVKDIDQLCWAVSLVEHAHACEYKEVTGATALVWDGSDEITTGLPEVGEDGVADDEEVAERIKFAMERMQPDVGAMIADGFQLSDFLDGMQEITDWTHLVSGEP